MYLNKSQNVSNNRVKMYPEKCQSVSKTESSQNVSKKDSKCIQNRAKMYLKQPKCIQK